MEFSFDQNLEYQKKAVQAVVDLFKGQRRESQFPEANFVTGETPSIWRREGNKLTLSQDEILANLKEVQKSNGIQESTALEGMNFSIEMETGTGKTYVYLRTIYHLNREYGFSKFIIVVPSVAIRKGVEKMLKITQTHFENECSFEGVPISATPPPPLDPDVYETGKVSLLEDFAGPGLKVLVINISSFDKDLNIINKVNEKGRAPIEAIQSVNPIVIVDEPQNMETTNRGIAISNLNPLCTLRYSATHRKFYNLIYKLSPVEAYDQGLVKQIEVDSLYGESSNSAFIELKSIKRSKTGLEAELFIDVNEKTGVERKLLKKVKSGADLFELSNHREYYRGYSIKGMDYENKFIEFNNDEIVRVGQRQDDLKDDIWRSQIRRTIEAHLDKELELRRLGVDMKVLSLFFIDRVANYRSYGADGSLIKGKFAVWFKEIYEDLIKRVDKYKSMPAYSDEMQNGYFSQDKARRFKDTSGRSAIDEKTYETIIEKKEELLDMQNPLRFIFSHSALREGWDNPNVFQICTLNETKSAMKKRQEIGRGLRLPVDKDGVRCFDRSINRLVVVANESYIDFAKKIQNEIKETWNVDFGNRIKSTKDKKYLKHREGFELDPLFCEIWEKIKYKTTYSVEYKTEELREKASSELSKVSINPVKIISKNTKVTFSNQGVTAKVWTTNAYDTTIDPTIPNDVLGEIANRTGLTRVTIWEILKRSGRLDNFGKNPKVFVDLIVSTIMQVLQELMIAGIKYQKIPNSFYEMSLFTNQEGSGFSPNDYTFSVSNTNKTIYVGDMPLQSKEEKEFAGQCEDRDEVKFYFKLPGWFKVPTPIGNYNPDWAIVFDDNEKIYFVAETKKTKEPDPSGKAVNRKELTSEENSKIDCGGEHFKKIDGVEYALVSEVDDLKDKKNRVPPPQESNAVKYPPEKDSTILIYSSKKQIGVKAKAAEDEEVAPYGPDDSDELHNAKDGTSETPLMKAARVGNLEAAKFLIEYGTDLNVRNDDGKTALSIAKERGHQDIVNLLLAHGAKP